MTAHFACNTNATTPAMRGADALVPVNSSVHRPFSVVVLCMRKDVGIAQPLY